MIVIIDYGSGNIHSIGNIYTKLNIPFLVTNNPKDLLYASHIILPGVGAFDYAMQQLNSSGMIEILEKRVIEDRIPLLGICVGMQILAKSSEEGSLCGLGWIDGVVQKFDRVNLLPHMGWNNVKFLHNIGLVEGITRESGQNIYIRFT